MKIWVLVADFVPNLSSYTDEDALGKHIWYTNCLKRSSHSITSEHTIWPKTNNFPILHADSNPLATALFYFKYVENDLSKDENRWTHLMHTQQVVAWQGLTFELVCLQHLQQIKKDLGIARD